MPRPDPSAVRRVACIGAGVIGSGWAAHFLARGYDVAAWDPGGEPAEALLREMIDAAWPALEQLGLAAGASRDRLSVVPTLADAEFVQESAPERLPLKVQLTAEIDAALDPAMVISSSTSAITMTDIQVACANPGRTVVGHPFNPPYLVPLVEVVPGARTDADVPAWTEALYDHSGKSGLILEDNLFGFLANRLQDAMWMEALHLLADGKATVAQIDQAIVDGPGLRWALMGPFMTFHVGGGVGGMAHNLAQFGAHLGEPYSGMPPIELTDRLHDTVVAGSEAMTAGRHFAEVVRERDAALVGVLSGRGLARQDVLSREPTTRPRP